MQRRVSFVPPPLTTSYSRDVLLTQRTGLLGADVMSQDEEEAADAIMANVEELIEGFDWTASAAAAAADSSRKGPDAIEQRLLDELAALENVSYRKRSELTPGKHPRVPRVGRSCRPGARTHRRGAARA
jgi:hypothetical protein